MTDLPPYASRDLIASRLRQILPEGTPNRSYCIRDLAASTVFAALYIGAVEGGERYFGPIHVYRMTTEQAAKPSQGDRLGYVAALLKKGGHIPGVRWYADNTREPIRDETLRDGLISIGVVRQRTDLPTTSGKPRYALTKEFAALFSPELQGEELGNAISDCQVRYLNKDAFDRIAIMRQGIAGKADGVLVTFPGGETRQLDPGPSSVIVKDVVEVFAPRFLRKPVLLWLSESGNKVVVRDLAIATRLGLKIEPDKNLPDLILADLGGPPTLLVFVEVVHTDGAITARRREAVYSLTDAAGFERSQICLVTAYADRESAGFKRTVSQLAWGSFAWFTSEPGKIVWFSSGSKNEGLLLAELLNPM